MDNIFFDNNFVSKPEREQKYKQKGCVLWFTGLSGSGKSTLAKQIERILFDQNKLVCVLDGDNLRHGINSNLKFTLEDRAENIRRTSEIAAILSNLGYITLVCLISPLIKERTIAKQLINNYGITFKEIYISTPIETCEKRDVKGLYKKARSGEILNFTGIDSPYEIPESPDITLDTTNANIAHSVNSILSQLL